MTRTPHYDLNELGPGGQLSDDGYKFGVSDRVLMDQKLWEGAEGHHHTGATLEAPADAPSLTIDPSGGTLKASTRYYYKYALVDSFGNQSPPSPESYVDTPGPVASPGGPSLIASNTGGTLISGNYTYYVSAYVDDSTTETKVGPAAFITVPSGTTNKVTIILPSLPTGATGFNIYRRVPNGSLAEFIASVDMTTATTITTVIDTGLEGDCDRTLPLTNRTSSSSSVVVSLPGATPSLVYSYTWVIYRTTTSGDYTNSFLHHVVEYTSEATPQVRTSYTDIGINTTAGSPVVSAGSPTKVLLTDGAEVQGELPAGMVEWFPHVLTFSYGGTLELHEGVFLWLCPFASAEILSVRAILGVESAPSAQPVVIDIRRGHGFICPTLDSLWVNPDDRPRVEVGYQYSNSFVPDFASLVFEDLLTCDIVQTGGGATPTDRNLTVEIYMKVHVV